jgi:hypothetical protein
MPRVPLGGSPRVEGAQPLKHLARARTREPLVEHDVYVEDVLECSTP